MRNVCFSGSYADCLHNFIIYGLPDEKCQDELLHSFVCILKNILLRGKAVNPSDYILSELSEVDFSRNTRPYPIFCRNDLNWDITIRRGGNSLPAKIFYNDLWDKIFPEYSWLKNFFIAEASLERILKDDTGDFANQNVDFYIVPAKLVIEIDGEQYHSTNQQHLLDIKRDDALKKAGFEVIRIPAKDILSSRDTTGGFSKIKNYLDADTLTTVRNIESFVDFSNLDDFNYNLSLFTDQVFRFEIAILELFGSGAISFNLKNYFDIAEEQSRAFEIAFNDVCLWLQNLYQLAGHAFQKPSFTFSKYSKTRIKIANDLFIKNDDSAIPDGQITIVTDLWDDDDYFEVSCAKLINYDINENLTDNDTDDPKLSALLFFLKNIFGFDSFNEGQLPIIINALNCRKTIGILPTGGGKSLCYQLAAILQPGLSFSICPLNSLQKDQKEELEKNHFTHTAYIASSQGKVVKLTIQNNFAKCKYLITWISPERFQSREFRDKIQIINDEFTIAYAIIDEVHCLSEWGHDFRTSYLNLIPTIENYCRGAIIFGLTATASQAVLKDLITEFNIAERDIKTKLSLKRENLNFTVIPTHDKKRELCRIISDSRIDIKNNCGIVFTLYSDKTGDPKASAKSFRLAEPLKEEFPDLAIERYHAKLDSALKEKIQNDFKNDKINVLVSTNAFGMGINKEDVRYTVHYELPWSVEAFYQEAGRAGRSRNKVNPKPADCYILFTPPEGIVNQDVDKLFAQDTTAEQIAAIQKSDQDYLNDLAKTFFLWCRDNKGIKQDVEDIAYTIDLLNHTKKIADNKGNTFKVISSDRQLTDDALELALYRLKLLGVITDWTIEWSAKLFTVYMSDVVDEQHTHDAFFRYIRNHEPSFGDDWDKQNKYKSIIEKEESSFLRNYAEALITWTYDNIIYSRRRMIQNIYEFSRTFKNSEDFKEKIDEFLKISNISTNLQTLAEDYKNWQEWLSIYTVTENKLGTLVSRELTTKEISEVHQSTARFLESYRNSTPLNLNYVLSGAMSDQYNQRLDTDLFDKCIEDIHTNYADSEKEIINRILAFLDKNKEKIRNSTFNDLTKVLVCNYPERIKEIYERFHDDSSAKALIYLANSRINNIWGEING